MKMILLLLTTVACATPPMHYAPKKPTPVSSKGQLNFTAPTPIPKAAPKIEYNEYNYYYCTPRGK